MKSWYGFVVNQAHELVGLLALSKDIITCNMVGYGSNGSFYFTTEGWINDLLFEFDVSTEETALTSFSYLYQLGRTDEELACLKQSIIVRPRTIRII